MSEGYEIYFTRDEELAICMAPYDNMPNGQIERDQKALLEAGFRQYGSIFSKSGKTGMPDLLDFLGIMHVEQREVENQCRKFLLGTVGKVEDFIQRYGEYEKKAVERSLGIFFRKSPNLQPGTIIWPKFKYKAAMVTGMTLGQIRAYRVNDDGKMEQLVSNCWLILIKRGDFKFVKPLALFGIGEKAPALIVNEFPVGIKTLKFDLPLAFFEKQIKDWCCLQLDKPANADIGVERVLEALQIVPEKSAATETWQAGEVLLHHYKGQKTETKHILKRTDSDEAFIINSSVKNNRHPFLLERLKEAERIKLDCSSKKRSIKVGGKEICLVSQRFSEKPIQLCPTLLYLDAPAETRLLLHEDFYLEDWQAENGSLYSAASGKLRVACSCNEEYIKLAKE